MTYERTLTINSDHPALPGHFPGHPVVPGDIVLEEVIQALREIHGQGVVVTGMPAVKLSSPLRPEERLTVTVESQESETEANQAVDGRCLENATGTRKPAVDPPDGLGGGVAGKTGGQGAAHSRLSLLSLPFR